MVDRVKAIGNMESAVNQLQEAVSAGKEDDWDDSAIHLKRCVSDVQNAVEAMEE